MQKRILWVMGLIAALLIAYGLLSPRRRAWPSPSPLGAPTFITAWPDPCLYNIPVYIPLNEATGSTTTIIPGVSGKQTWICGMAILPVASAININLVEGTGTNCSSVSAGLFGGTTAANGANIAVNGGFIWPSDRYIAVTATPGDNVCYTASTSTQVSGGIKFVYQ